MTSKYQSYGDLISSIGQKTDHKQKPDLHPNGVVSVDIDRTVQCLDQTERGSKQYKQHTPSQRAIELYSYREIPHFLQGNPYVIRGYRVNLSKNMCYKSLLVWSNETINMWTHFLGFIVFFWIMVYDNMVVIPRLKGSPIDHLILSAGLLCYQFCMICSTGYHVFRCHSEHANKKWLAYDLTGISIGLLGCYLPGVHYAFYCLSVWRDIYLMIISALFAAVLFYQTQTRYYSEEWFHRRIVLYCGLAGYGIIPTVHWIFLNGGLQTEIVKLFVPKVAVVYMLGMLAFMFYISKAPEACCPGQFDYIGSSHQLWHVIVVLAFLWWHSSGLQLLTYRLEHAC